MNKDRIEQPIDGILDLHTFNPSDIKELVPEYLGACRDRGILQVRIIHGKGIGAMRTMVKSILTRSSIVESYYAADTDAGGWGATIVLLRRMQ